MIDRSGQCHAVAVDVADHLGIHLTTARFRLDQLTAAGLIQRRADTMKRRGRPHLLYAPAGLARDGHAHEQPIQVLAGALAHENSVDTDASRAGRRCDAASENPEVVCAVHRGLIEQLLDGTTRQARLIPFVETELCVVALERAGSQVGEAGP